MKYFGLARYAVILALMVSCLAPGAAEINGIPMTDHHARAFGSEMRCETCHETKTPTDRPSDKACVKCHGSMDKIPTPPNKFDKFPHASPHYGDTLDCTICHSEHKPSRALCNDCHIVQWKNFH